MWITQTNKHFCGQNKLFTLKHSRKTRYLPLKHSRFSAETLPHSIYTYSYLYKKTISCWMFAVDKWKKFICLSLFLTAMILSSCASNQDQKIQNSMLQELKTPHKCFRQYSATKNNPPSFYTCDQRKQLCTR